MDRVVMRLASVALAVSYVFLISLHHVRAGPVEVMLLTSWGGALERFAFSGTTYGVHFATMNPQSASQKWIVDTATKTIRSSDDFCLIAPMDKWNFESDLMVMMTKCESPPPSNQQWTYGLDMAFRVTLTKASTSKTYCLDADANTRPVNNVVHGWDCSDSHANGNQQWTLFYPGYQIKAGDKCIGLAKDNTDGEQVHVVQCVNDALQRWKYDFANGALRLGAASSAMCVDSYPAGESGYVHMWHCDPGNENQQVDFKILRTDGTRSVSGYFFIRDSVNCLTVNADGSKIVSATCDAKTTVFTLETDLPADLCGTKVCKNGGSCAFGRCRCPEGFQGDDCGTVGERVRIRATNGRFLTVGSSGYSLENSLLDSQTRQQVWYHFAQSGMIKVYHRRMCLEAVGDDAALAICRMTEAKQKWIYELSTGRLQLKGTNRCLDADVRSSNPVVRIKDCTMAINGNQVWEELSPEATAVNSDMFATMIRHRASLSLCWTVVGGKLLVAACAATTNQLWSFNDAYTGAGALCSGDSCAVAKSGPEGKSSVALLSYDSQRLEARFEYESGTGQIRMVSTNMCIAKSNDASYTLLMVPCMATDTAQLWYVAKLDKCLSSDFLTLKDKCVMGKCEFGRCQCQPGFEGPTCSSDSCSMLQCNNGGACTLGKCSCLEGYAGTFCDDFIKCTGVKCLNDGACSREGKCDCPVGFSGERCHIKHPRVLLRGLEYQAIGLTGGLVAAVIPDVRNTDHVWIWDATKGMVRSLSSTTMCLEQIGATDLGVSVCNASKTTQTWVYSSITGKLATTAVSSLVVGFEKSVTGRYRPRLVTIAPPSSDLDLGFIELDRLDLPGSSIRTYDRSKCLSASSDGSFSTADCNGDDESQQWEYHPQNGALRLPRLGAPMCLTVNGVSVAMSLCDGDDNAQQFDFDFATKRFRNRKSQFCLVLDAGSLTLATCSQDIVPPRQVLRIAFRGFCDVINMCERDGVCWFGRCACQNDRRGSFCEVEVESQ